MSKNRGVSVIIPCFNDGRFLTEAVESVYAQNTKLPFEIILIDDCSTDLLTLEVIADLQTAHPDITVIRQPENFGVAEARNAGLRAAQYDYIFPLDADNRLAIDPALISGGRGYMDRCTEILETDPGTVLVRCKAHIFGKRTPHWQGNETFDEKSMLNRGVIDTFAMYRKDEALAAGGYDSTIPFCEDWDFAIAMLNRRHVNGLSARVHTIQEPLFHYRIRNDETNRGADHGRSGMSHAQLLQYMIDRSPELYRKHYPQIPLKKMADHLENKEHRRQVLSARLQRVFNPLAWPGLAVSIAKKIDARFPALAAAFRHSHPAGNPAKPPEQGLAGGPR